MSSENPYYRSVAENDDEFAQEPSEHQNYCKSAYEHIESSRHQRKPFFSSVNYPSIPPYSPPPIEQPQNQKESIFSSFIEKYKNKRNAQDLSSATQCPKCKQITESFIVKKNSFIVWILCIFLLITTYVCFFLPFMSDTLKNKHIICKNCGKTKFVVKAC